jgi:uncharacterized membrane protein YkoI
MRLLTLPLLSLPLLACAAHGPGRLDAKLVRAATDGPVEKVQIFTDADGAVNKVSVYHRDAGPAPEQLRRLALQQYPGAELRQHELELYRDHGWVHEVELTTADGQRCEVSASAAWTLRYTECQMAPEKLAQPLRDAAAKLVPGGEIVEAELHKEAGREEYRLEVKRQDELHYLRLQPDGALIRHSRRVAAMLEVAQP